MPVPVICYEVIMLVRMSDGMCMRSSSVCMSEGMDMLVRVGTDESIDNYKHRARYHHRKSSGIRPRKLFLKEYERKERPDERRRSVVRAGLSCAQNALRPYVKEYAEAVSNKAQKQCKRNVFKNKLSNDLLFFIIG